MKSDAIIGIVGPCKSGKTEIREELIRRGYQVREIAQEHSFVPDMWKRIANPDILIYLDVSYLQACARGQLDWNEQDYENQLQRLSHARGHADIYIQTDDLTPEEVLEKITPYLV